MGAVLGDAHAAGVKEPDALRTLLVDLDVGVTVYERVSLAQLGEPVDAVVPARAVHVAVRQEQVVSGLGVGEQGIVCHAGEVEHHLVDLGLAVAAYGQHLASDAIEHLDHLLGGIVLGQVVARPVVEQVAQEHHAVGLMTVDGLHQAGAPLRGSVDVGCYEQLHASSSSHGMAGDCPVCLCRMGSSHLATYGPIAPNM